MSEEVDASVTPPVGEVGSFISDMVSPTVAAEVPLAKSVDEAVMDPVGVLPLAAARGVSCLK